MPSTSPVLGSAPGTSTRASVSSLVAARTKAHSHRETDSFNE